MNWGTMMNITLAVSLKPMQMYRHSYTVTPLALEGQVHKPGIK